MPTPLEQRAISASQDRTDTRLTLQDRQPESSVKDGAVKNVSALGIDIETQSGGIVRIPPKAGDAQGFTPDIGQRQQVSLTGSGATLAIKTQPTGLTPETVGSDNVVVFARPPVDGNDFGRPGVLWINIDGATGSTTTAPMWVWAQALGTFVQVGGGAITLYGVGHPDETTAPGTHTDGTKYINTRAKRGYTYFDGGWNSDGPQHFSAASGFPNVADIMPGDLLTYYNSGQCVFLAHYAGADFGGWVPYAYEPDADCMVDPPGSGFGPPDATLDSDGTGHDGWDNALLL